MLQNWEHIPLQLNKNKLKKKNTNYELQTFIRTAENDRKNFKIEIGVFVRHNKPNDSCFQVPCRKLLI